MSQRDISAPMCANCGCQRITYQGSDGKRQMVLLFAVPADAPLDDDSIKRYGTQFALSVARTLREERRRRDGELPTLIVTR